MRAGVLRPHVHGHHFGADFGHHHTISDIYGKPRRTRTRTEDAAFFPFSLCTNRIREPPFVPVTSVVMLYAWRPEQC
jgi:hypothetical protein